MKVALKNNFMQFDDLFVREKDGNIILRKDAIGMHRFMAFYYNWPDPTLRPDLSNLLKQSEEKQQRMWPGYNGHLVMGANVTIRGGAYIGENNVDYSIDPARRTRTFKLILTVRDFIGKKCLNDEEYLRTVQQSNKEFAVIADTPKKDSQSMYAPGIATVNTYDFYNVFHEILNSRFGPVKEFYRSEKEARSFEITVKIDKEFHLHYSEIDSVKIYNWTRFEFRMFPSRKKMFTWMKGKSAFTSARPTKFEPNKVLNQSYACLDKLKQLNSQLGTFEFTRVENLSKELVEILTKHPNSFDELMEKSIASKVKFENFTSELKKLKDKVKQVSKMPYFNKLCEMCEEKVKPSQK